MSNYNQVHIGIPYESLISSLDCLYQAVERLADFRDSLPMASKDYHELGAIRELIRDGAGPIRATFDNFDRNFRERNTNIRIN